MNKRYFKRPLLTLILGLALIAAACLGIYFVFQPTEYEKHGTEVDFTVVSVKTGGRRVQKVTVKYTDDNGAEVTAQAIMNRWASEGDEDTGFVLADKPEKVYRPADIGLKLILAAILAVAALAGLYDAVLVGNYMISKRKLAKHSTRVTAEINSFKLLKKNLYDVNVTFKDENGEDQTADFIVRKIRPHAGQRIDIVYFKKSNGKFFCDLP